MYQCKVTCLTPKNQAAKSVESMKKSIIGLNAHRKVIHQKVIRHDQFYWIVECQTPTEANRLVIKASLANTAIKAFYHRLIRTINKANKLAERGSKGIEYIKRWVKNKLTKHYKNDKNKDMLMGQIDHLTKEDLKGFLHIDDLPAMQELLKKELVTVELIDYPE